MFKWLGKKIEKFTTIFHGGVVIEKEVLEPSNETILNVNVNDALTTTTLKSLIKVDYDKSGIAATGIENTTIGLDVNLADTATNHSSSVIEMRGINIDIDSASNQGYIWQRGIHMNIASDDIGDVTTARGLEMTVMDGGYDIMLHSSVNSSDYCTIATTTNGATSITTNDGVGTLAHFEIAADGDITLDSAGQIKLEPVAGNNILLDGTIAVDAGVVTGATSITSTWFSGSLDGQALAAVTADTVTAAAQPAIEDIGTAGDNLIIRATQLYMENLNPLQSGRPFFVMQSRTDDNAGPHIYLRNYRQDESTGAAKAGVNGDACGTIYFKGHNSLASGTNFAKIKGIAADCVAANAAGKLEFDVMEFDGTLSTGLTIDGDTNANGEIDVTIGAGAGSTVTIPGQLIAANGGMGAKHFGEYIKLIPSDFVANDDGGNTRLGIGYVDTAGEADYGMRISHNDTELFAFVSIPQGMKATHVEVFGRRAKAVEVFEVQINASTITSKGTGTCGIPADAIGDEEFAITNVTSTATNLLAIEVTVTSNSADRVYGARVKIAQA